MSTALQIHEPAETGTAVATVERRSLGLLRPLAQPAEIIQQQEEVRKFIAATLKEGRDYGKVPGVDRDVLFKPGAERTCAGFGVIASFQVTEREADHSIEVPWRKTKYKYEWKNGRRGKKIGEEVTEGVSYGLYRYVVECTLTHRETGIVLAKSLGSCSTMESKYIDRPRDCENTVLKMAEKRAFVGSTLIAFGLSEQFTQDVEDMPREQFERDGDEAGASDAAHANEPEAKCPTCGGPMWDNRSGKTNPRAPDFKCKDRSCEGVYWPGQWPPAPSATEAQIDALLTLTDRAECPEKVRAKIRAGLEKGITAEKAQKWIQELEAKITAAAGAPDWLANEEAEEDAELARATGQAPNPQTAPSTSTASTQSSGGNSTDTVDGASPRSSATTGGRNTTTEPAESGTIDPDSRVGRMQRIRAMLEHPALAKEKPDVERRLTNGMTDRELVYTLQQLERATSTPTPAPAATTTKPKGARTAQSFGDPSIPE